LPPLRQAAPATKPQETLGFAAPGRQHPGRARQGCTIRLSAWLDDWPSPDGVPNIVALEMARAYHYAAGLWRLGQSVRQSEAEAGQIAGSWGFPPDTDNPADTYKAEHDHEQRRRREGLRDLGKEAVVEGGQA
jgi:hypothetical protein